MFRRIAMAALLFGAVGGFASALGPCRDARAERRAAFENHVADLCVAAAERAQKAAPARTSDAP